VAKATDSRSVRRINGGPISEALIDLPFVWPVGSCKLLPNNTFTLLTTDGDTNPHTSQTCTEAKSNCDDSLGDRLAESNYINLILGCADSPVSVGDQFQNGDQA
jgi:hypothetical protein